jgi:hypothetical protein
MKGTIKGTQKGEKNVRKRRELCICAGTNVGVYRVDAGSMHLYDDLERKEGREEGNKTNENRKKEGREINEKDCGGRRKG